MTQQEQQLKIQELINDEEYMKKLLSLGTVEAISKELEEQDIELSPDDLRTIYDLLKKKADGELSDEELEQVTGGMGLGGIIGCAIVAVLAVATLVTEIIKWTKASCDKN